MQYTPILATLGYILSPDGARVLMVHRNRRPDDPHFGKFNGLGGKLDPAEDVVAGMRREIKEEANLECTQLVLRGTVSWPGFGKQGEDWFGFIFRVDGWTGTPRQANDEGDLLWVDLTALEQLSLWEGDRYFLPLVFGKDQRQFHGVMPYHAGRPMSWSCSWLGLPDAALDQDAVPRRTAPAQTHVQAARRLLSRGEADQAVDILDVHRPAEWVVVDAASAEVLRLLGQAYVLRGDWRTGRECLEQLQAAQRQQRLLPALQYAAALTDLLRCYTRLGLDDLASSTRAELAQCAAPCL
jgi:8-oxo-dGTP diphosphatase